MLTDKNISHIDIGTVLTYFTKPVSIAVAENERKKQEGTSSPLWMSDVLFEQLSRRVSSVMDYIIIVVDVASTHSTV